MVFNPGSERGILSICLRSPEKLIDVDAAEIFAEHFAVQGHKYIFTAMMYLFKKNIMPTAMSILEVLPQDKARKAVDELGGLEYLTILEETPITKDNLGIFIDKVKQSYTRGKLYEIAKDIEEFMLSDNADVLNPTELIQRVEMQLMEIETTSNKSTDIYKMGDETDEVLERRMQNPEQIPGLETGWTEFDKKTMGFQPGDLVIVVAPSKTGKSVILTNWATKFGIYDQLPILYIDTEMSHREQEDRILASLSGVQAHEIVSGMYVMDTENGLAVDKVERVKKARNMLGLGNYYHVYMPQYTIEQVSALARRFMVHHNVKAMFFDYIKIPSNQASFKTQQEYQALGYATSGLKDLAGMLQIPIAAAAQTNRNDLDTNEPDASNIGGSYRILQLATKLMFLVNKSDEQIAKDGSQNGNQMLFIKYQRNGESDCAPIYINFNKHILRMSEV